ncbi:MAG: LCP family protein [Clostridia bacterium]|nr:LCP family protein [Clostridia bacterium]
MKKRTKFAILASIAVVVIAAGVIGGVYLHRIINDQGSVWERSTPVPQTVDISETEATPTPPVFTLEPGATPTPTPTPTIDPFVTLQEQADTSMMKDIVNILVIGVDADEYRETSSEWNGKSEWHSDVMLVIAVNFEDMCVDMISLPRDTYANIPDVKGIYKLNAAINCGGGYMNDDGTVNYAGFEKVCEAAEWMLGGIPVDYYYAVNMDTVKALVNEIGGIEYEIEGYFDIGGRFYEPGLQHMDGQAVLDYMRVRKKSSNTVQWTISTSDTNRVNRQKQMLVALFQKMKNENLITNIPGIVSAFSGRLFTNCTAGQTAALATFAYQLDPANIRMHTMGGNSGSYFGWNFVFTNQANRVELINQVYGVKVSQYPQYTIQYGKYRWGTMLEEHYLDLCKPLTEYVQKLIDADDLLPEFTPEPSASVSPSPSISPEVSATPDIPTIDTSTATPSVTAEPTSSPSSTGEGTGAYESFSPAARLSSVGYYTEATPLTRQYTEEQRQLFKDYLTCLDELDDARDTADSEAKKARNGKSNSLSSAANKYLDKLTELQDKAIALAKEFGYEKKNFENTCYPNENYRSRSAWALNYWDDKSVNEVNVDFN